jgi:hypothetical protein
MWKDVCIQIISYYKTSLLNNYYIQLHMEYIYVLNILFISTESPITAISITLIEVRLCLIYNLEIKTILKIIMKTCHVNSNILILYDI